MLKCSGVSKYLLEAKYKKKTLSIIRPCACVTPTRSPCTIFPCYRASYFLHIDGIELVFQEDSSDGM